MVKDLEGGAQARLMTPPTTAEQQADAIQVIKTLNERGELKPIEGWEGSTLAGYLDILGLNNRQPVGNERFNLGIQSGSTPGSFLPRKRRRKPTEAAD